MFEWSDMRMFLAVVRHGSAAEAARHLGTNQTTVSRRIARLEAALSLTLFDFGARGAIPTEAARRLLADAEAMEAAADALDVRARDMTRRLSGTIRLTANPIAIRYAAGLTARFRQQHPEARFEIDSQPRTLSLEDGEADVALRPAVQLEGDTLVARKLMDHPWGFYASKPYIAQHGAPRSFDDLATHRLVRCTGEYSFSEPMASTQARYPQTTEITDISSLDGMIGLIHAGEGVGIAPRAEGDIDPLLEFCFGDPALKQGLWLVTSRAGHADPLIRGFMAFCAKHLPDIMRDLPPEWRM
ncbi:LysR family transcriptional regulator [Sulfitobacter sp. S190]|uniref:LysR family transcriptional regulator n=1 Tax=Sulfitobacter sp. S190 TaxID=2867022 RepID=UPI0021A87F5D|nr:LysR family transcriptional regulator [Sulfitobacter sp. S190]UWR21598.1 LysR family transcriptional regulator [Sulfitobacter sp. S190]